MQKKLGGLLGKRDGLLIMPLGLKTTEKSKYLVVSRSQTNKIRTAFWHAALSKPSG